MQSFDLSSLHPLVHSNQRRRQSSGCGLGNSAIGSAMTTFLSACSYVAGTPFQYGGRRRSRRAMQQQQQLFRALSMGRQQCHDGRQPSCGSLLLVRSKTKTRHRTGTIPAVATIAHPHTGHYHTSTTTTTTTEPRNNRNNSHELVRHYVGRKLSEYYAQPAEAVVGQRGSTIAEAATTTAATTAAFNGDGESSSPLSSLWGEWHWKRLFQRMYDTRQGHWLTPVELFQPHYSHILGNFCAEQSDYWMHSLTTNTNATTTEIQQEQQQQEQQQQQLYGKWEIVELGCGRGTNAELILSYLKATRPQAYDRLQRYTLVDASPTLHQWQKEQLLGNGTGAGGEHAEKLNFCLMDLTDVAENKAQLLSKSDTTTPTIVLGLEVLDNLPHDKVRGRTRKALEQAEVVVESNNNIHHPKEVFAPLTDPLLQKVLRKMPSYVSSHPQWVPSVACGVLHHILRQRHNVALVMSDFDWLPPPDLNQSTTSTLQHRSEYAEGEPIVTDMSGQDHECYLTSPPQSHCDILFPTDFQKLATFVQKCLTQEQSRSLQVRVQKQSDFLQEWGPTQVAQTRSWIGTHNPLLHDFVNCSVLSVSYKREGPLD